MLCQTSAGFDWVCLFGNGLICIIVIGILVLICYCCCKSLLPEHGKNCLGFGQRDTYHMLSHHPLEHYSIDTEPQDHCTSCHYQHAIMPDPLCEACGVVVHQNRTNPLVATIPLAPLCPNCTISLYSFFQYTTVPLKAPIPSTRHIVVKPLLRQLNNISIRIDAFAC